jgi:hypothetical protein
VASSNPLNVKGLNDFLRFAWPLVRSAVPAAEFRIVGRAGESVDVAYPGVRIMGQVADLASAYADSRVVINPAVAGTGLKIKTVEALCHSRPIVLWPSGVDGLADEVAALCCVARNWFDFAEQVVELLTAEGSKLTVNLSEAGLAEYVAADRVYAPLGAALRS